MVIIKIIILSMFLFVQQGGNPPIIPPACDNDVPFIKNPNCNPNEIPISGLEWLAIGGGIYGIKKLKQKEDLK